MMLRHDYVTPYINGIRFFDKPPLLYWMASSSMTVFGIKDWAARLPLALAVLALLLAVYALGIRLFAAISPASPDRAGFYAALALATSIGPYLYTRFYIPDILLALWMTLAVHLFLIALDRIHEAGPNRVPHLRDSLIVAKVGHRESDPLSSPSHQTPVAPSIAHLAKPENLKSSPLLPCLAFAAVMALNVLTKGLIGLVFPIAFVLLYLAITKQLRLLLKLHLLASTTVFLLIAAPWHILASLRNPAIPLPAGVGLPATAGWAWFYLYNEHIARFLSKRIPHDYGQTPIWLFWLFTALWMVPWVAFIPDSIPEHLR
ncbi:MAG TPA: glycosyltransferase family 39 protein, partial [Edaphobacter sp.]|nr:glycosyltransferase family 39 protein [Edaphobacter sp.]